MESFEERQRDAYLERRSSFGEIPSLSFDMNSEPSREIEPGHVQKAYVVVACIVIAVATVIVAAFTSK